MLIDALRDALGEEPSDRAIWKATRGPRKSVELARRTLGAYQSEIQEPTPEKSPTHFRPAYLSDYSGRSSTPYDREFAFIDRALCYADSVAVENELTYWSDESKLEDSTIESYWTMGAFDCDHATWSLRRIAKYGWMEESGLLYYVDAIKRQRVSKVAGAFDLSTMEDLFDLVMKRRPYIPEMRKFPSALVPDLAYWFREYGALVEYCSLHKDYVDLYLPSWFAGPEILEWHIKQTAIWAAGTTEMVISHDALTKLIVLPAVPEVRATLLGKTTLLKMREGAELSRWRTDFQEALTELEGEDNGLSRARFRNRIDDARKRLVRDVSNDRKLSDEFTGTVSAGVASGITAAALGQGVLATALIGAAPAGVSLAKALIKWLTVEPENLATEPLYRLFMDGGQRSPSGSYNFDSAPNTLATDTRGRIFNMDWMGNS